MWIVEPFFVSVEVSLSLFRLFIAIGFCRVRTTVGLTNPLTSNRELTPGAGKYFADIDLVIISSPVFVIHPPVPIVFELVVKFFS